MDPATAELLRQVARGEMLPAAALARLRQRGQPPTTAATADAAAAPTLPAAGAPDAQPLSGDAEAWVATLIGRRGHATPQPADYRQNFLDLGLTSADLLGLSGDLEAALGVDIYPTLFFEHQNIVELAAHLRAEQPAALRAALDRAHADARPAVAALPPSRPPAPAAPPVRPAPAAPSVQPADAAADAGHVAVIGMSGRFGESPDLDAFWSNLAAGRDLMREIPASRWDHRPWFDENRDAANKTYCKWGSFVADVDQFDPLFFNLAPRQAVHMDPQLRLLLEVMQETIEDAGLARRIAGSRTGVFAGACLKEYWEEIVRLGLPLCGDEHVGSLMSSLANFPSYVFDLRGPSVLCDDACSASLVALHLACSALRRGDCDMAFVVAANLLLSPLHYVALSRIGALSPSGRCHSFDARADGYVPGEAVCAVLLKPLAAALRDGNRIHAVIRGSATNHGGRANNPTAPRTSLQKQLLEAAWRDAGIDAAALDLVEAHGTGTSLGDPVEFEALCQAFAGTQRQGAPCVLTSAKAHLGHTEGAAGLTGVLKTILSLKAGSIPAMPDCRRDNPLIRVAGSPFAIARASQAWPPGPRKRMAGVSSFGMGGAYAHVVIEEAPPPAAVAAPDAPVLVMLSARSEAALRDAARRLLRFVEAGLAGAEASPALDHRCSLVELAHALALRQEQPHRLAAVVDDRRALAALLAGWLDGAATGERIWSGHAPPAPPHPASFEIDARSGEPRLREIAAAWIAGASVGWSAADRQRVVSVPSSSFERKRYWIDTTRASLPAPAAAPDTPPAGPPAVAPAELLTLAWTPQELPNRPAGARPRRVLLLAADGHAVGRLAPRPGLEIRIGPPLAALGGEAELAGLLAMDGARQPVTDLLLLLDPPPAADAAAQLGQVERLLQLARAQLALRPREPITTLCVARRDPATMLAARAVAGLARSLRLEAPKLHWKLLETEEAAPDPELLLRELLAGDGEAVVRHDRDGRRVERLAAIPGDAAAAFVPGGVYLVTGGAGGLGGLVARHLARRPGIRLALAGRSAETPRVRELLAGLQAAGAAASYHRADVGDRDAVLGLVRAVRQAHGGLDGIIHAAGVIEDGLLADKPAAAIRRVLAGKLAGALHLDEATAGLPLQAFVCFTSHAGIAGNAGQADYAAANSLLDEFGAWRQAAVARGLRSGHSVSIAWPWWQEGGMQVPPAWAATLPPPLSTAAGLDAFDRALAAGPGRIIVATPPWRQRLDSMLQQQETAAPMPSLPMSPDLAAQAEALLTRLVGEVLQVPPHQLDAGASLKEYGIDSLAITRFNQRLAEHFADLSKTLFFEFQTIRALARHLAEQRPAELLAATGPLPAAGPPHPAAPAIHAPAAAATPSRATPRDEGAGERIAIIGMAGRYPGAPDLEALWRNLCDGHDAITEIPASRWDHAPYFDPSREEMSYAKWGGFLDEVDRFDPQFFGMSPHEAMLVDPQERLFLEAAWLALEDAGYTRAALRAAEERGQAVGVFAGATCAGYELLAAPAWARGQMVTPTSTFWSIANRVSYVLDLHGPSLAIDTACSASLTAIHLACESIRRGECTAAIAGGVNLYLHPMKYVALCQRRFLSSDGKCRSFGAGGDGYVPGEGVGAVLLKRLDAAIADGDRIHATILASSINHGGHTHGFTVPNQRAQAALIEDAIVKAGIDPRSISLVEAHGTGTALGDPVELNALSQAFRRFTGDRGFCAIGSIKSNIGHGESVAGIAGLTKLLLQMRHRTKVPTLHAEEANPNIQIDGTPFFLQRTREAWQGERLRAALSSFGAGGANAHLILEEGPALPVAAAAPEAIPTPELVLLSARGPEALRAQAQRLVAFLEEGEASLADIAHTLRVGREAFRHRLAVVAADKAELAARLRAFLAGEAAVPGLLSGQLGTGEGALRLMEDDPADRSYLALLWEGGRLAKLARLWASGEAIDWASLPNARQARRVSVPSEPFARRRIWFDELLKAADGAAPEPLVAAAAERVARPATPAAAPIEPAVATPAPSASPPASADAASPEQAIAQAMRRQLAVLLNRPEASIDELAELGEFGIEHDAPEAVALVERINRDFGARAKAIRLLDYPTLRAFAGYAATTRETGERAALDASPTAPVAMALASGAPAAMAVPAAVSAVAAQRAEPPAGPPQAGLAEVLRTIKASLARLLFIDEPSLDENEQLHALGLDSVVAAAWVKQINTHYGSSIRAMRIYDHATLRKFAAHVVEELGKEAGGSGSASAEAAMPAAPDPVSEAPREAAPAWQPPPVPMSVPAAVAPAAVGALPAPAVLVHQTSSAAEATDAGVPMPIAIIGAAGRFAAADNLAEYEANLVAARECVGPPPADRWDAQRFYDPDPSRPGMTDCPTGGFLRNVDQFDPLFFNLSGQEAELMDPQQRLFLETAWHALEDAGYAPESLAGSRTGVFAGVAANGYREAVHQAGVALGGQTLTGNDSAILSGRVSYFLDLVGPSVSVDTACSSSLVAVHLACESLRSGASELALAGGVCVLTSPQLHVMASKAGMLSRRGRCAAFDAGADGFVPGEGVGVVVLKPLSRALAAGDAVRGVILGSGMNQDGRTNGLTAPSGRAQARLVREVLARSGVAASSIGYVETHGTGTRLGDPIEVAALAEAFGPGLGRGVCALGSVKSNIGHTLTAAGVAGLLKVLLGLRRAELFPSLHFAAGNPEIDWNGPFFVNTQRRRWEPAGGAAVRRAAVSSFGFSGTNCHLVVEEAPAVAARPAARGPRLVVLSGRSAAAVRQRRADLLAWLEGPGATARLEDVAHTLGAGRSHFGWRQWWVVEDLAGLRSALSAAGEPVRAAASETVAAARPGLDAAGLSALGAAYAAGARLDWAGLVAGESPQRLSLPGYPFERRRYWAASRPGEPAVPAAAPVASAAPAPVAVPVALPAAVPAAAPVAIASPAPVAAPVAPAVALPEGATAAGPVTLLVRDWVAAPAAAEQPVAGPVLVLACGAVVPPAALAGLADWTLVGDAAAQAALGAARFVALDPWEAASGAAAAAALAEHPAATLLDLMDVAPMDMAPPGPQAPAGTPPGTPAGTPLGTPAGIPPGTPAGTLPGAAIPWGRIVLLQALLRRGGLRRLLHVTRGGQGFGLAPGRLEGALLRSLVLAAGQEERLPAASVDCEPEQALPLAALLGRAETGEVAYRAGGRFLRRLRALAEVPAAAPAPLPAERPCVISGGSGDLGQTLAWHLLRQGARRLVLLGRRPRAALAAAIAALEQAGAQVAYYAGPLAEAPLRAFLAGLEAEWGAQYGTVLHCAGQVPPLGRFAERSVAAMAATLEPKLEGSALLWRLLGERAERFVLFSSISGSGPALAAGLADYAAANAWQDAFARQQQGAAARVVALGWGSWGETGRSAGAQARRYLDERGILAMSTAAALGAFEQALASGAAELVVSRMGPAYAALAPVSPPPALAAPAWLGSLQGRLEGWARAAAARAGARLEPATLAAVAALEAHSLGRLGEALGLTPGAVRRDLVRLAVAPRHERLLASWLARLRQAGDWRAAAAAAGPALAAPPWQAHLALLESCLAGYPRLLADAVPATELLFAGASPERVAAVYAGDPLADAHHQAMAELVRQVVAARLAAGVAPVRVLEVGAGTGGTSGFVLAALAELGGGVEYHYTDLSPALLQWARQRHAGYGFARFFVLDAEAAPAAAEPRYDLILASNVVHATRRLERTLGGLKARLKGHGTLLLAEMTAEQTYAAMTFGLLEGWWRFEDAARRLGESPLASVAQWRQLLAECGFRCEVLGLAPGLPQSLLVCESDGLHDASPDTAAAMSAAVPAGATAAVPADAAAAVPADAAAAVPADAAAAVPADAAAAIGPELLEVAAAALKVAATELALDQPVGQYGIDSILAVDLIARLNEHFGVELRSTDLFNHATFGGVAAEILRLRRRRTTQPSPAASAPPATPAPAEVASATPAPAEASTPAAPAPARPATRTAPAAAPAQDDDDDAVAIIGLAGRFPGAADPDAFWANLAAGRDSIAPPGPRRTGWAGWTGARCGLLDDIDGFDAAFFQIAPREIADPRQRLVLEECWKALESAGQTEARLSGRACGVYIGVERGETPDATDFRATLNSLIPARIGFALNLKGPCLAVDTACSSSLVAVQLAWEAVRHGTCELALAGGVHLMPSPATLQALGPSGMLSPSGVCRPFDAQADGMVLAEGVGLVVLKRLRQALAEGDPIRAVIRGAALNYDGRTSSVTAPSAPSQAALQRQIYHRFGLDPASFGLVEAHGTGTPLGDPIELQALAEAFADFTPQRGFCALASVKANIGHAAAASGIAGLIKLVLALEHRQIPPQLHFHTPNPALRLAETPFHVPTHLQGWPRRDGQPRRAAISSFGASGTNCHMVLEEAPDRPEPNPAEPPGPWLVPLSAKTAAALARRLHDLRDWLRRPHPHSPSLARISHTLARRRSHFPQRWIAIAHTTTDLAEQLDRALRHTPDAIAQHPPTPSGHPNLDHAARLYHQGHTPDWDSITTQHTLTTIPLPTYPFERQGGEARAHPFIDAAHPLQPDSRRVRTRLAAADLIVRDHAFDGRPVLPAAAYLELARAAGALAAPDRVVCEIADIVWQRPVLPSADGLTLTTQLATRGETIAFEILGTSPEPHAHGILRVATRAPQPPDRLPIELLRSRCARRLDGEEVYARFRRLGVDYGPSFRAVRAVQYEDATAIGTIAPPPASEPLGSQCLLNPFLLDAALQTLVALQDEDAAGQPIYIPHSLELLRIHAPLATARFVHATLDGGTARLGRPARTRRYDLLLLDEQGGVLAELRSLVTRPALLAPAPAPDHGSLEELLEAVRAGQLSVEEADRMLG